LQEETLRRELFLEPDLEDKRGEITLDEIFPESFIRQYSCFFNVKQFLKSFPFWKELDPDEIIGSSKWETYIKENTIFDSWKGMKLVAIIEWMERKEGEKEIT